MTRAVASDASVRSTRSDLDDIYCALQQGMGRERVDDDNVAALIEMAATKGDRQLEVLLREWRATCGDDPGAPELPEQLPPKQPPP